jgi:hypothetical protein
LPHTKQQSAELNGHISTAPAVPLLQEQQALFFYLRLHPVRSELLRGPERPRRAGKDVRHRRKMPANEILMARIASFVCTGAIIFCDRPFLKKEGLKKRKTDVPALVCPAGEMEVNSQGKRQNSGSEKNNRCNLAKDMVQFCITSDINKIKPVMRRKT